MFLHLAVTRLLARNSEVPTEKPLLRGAFLFAKQSIKLGALFLHGQVF